MLQISGIFCWPRIDRLSSNPTQTARTLGLLGGGGALLEFFSTPFLKAFRCNWKKTICCMGSSSGCLLWGFVAISPSLLSTSIIESYGCCDDILFHYLESCIGRSYNTNKRQGLVCISKCINWCLCRHSRFGPLVSSTFINYFGIDKGVTIIYSICCALMSINTYLMGSMFPETLKPSERKLFKLSDAAPGFYPIV